MYLLDTFVSFGMQRRVNA